jgi:hypothetical protein
MVLGRPLKGLRQKDIDPNEREAIMTEMFKRVRPHLELNIEKAKAKAEKRREEASREDEERRKQDAVRAQRLMRRAEGIPVHLLEGGAADVDGARGFRGASAGAAAASATLAAPRGGDVPEDVEVAMADALVRALVRDGATEPEGEWKTCAELKVLIARFFGNASAGGKNVVAHMRTRWAHPEYGEALGFVLAMCAADRDERVALRRHPKRPEAIDLASVRATEKGRRSVAEDAAEKAGEKREADAKEADETAGGTTEKGEGPARVPPRVPPPAGVLLRLLWATSFRLVARRFGAARWRVGWSPGASAARNPWSFSRAGPYPVRSSPRRSSSVWAGAGPRASGANRSGTSTRPPTRRRRPSGSGSGRRARGGATRSSGARWRLRRRARTSRTTSRGSSPSPGSTR